MRVFSSVMRRAAVVCAAALLAVATAGQAQSQATTGIIRGTVTGPNGTAVAGATVLLRETRTGFQRSITTNEGGIFVASLLPLGTYDVTARAVGFNEVRRTGIPVRVGETVDLALMLAAIELQAVTVEAELPVVDITQVESATRFSEEAVANTPNNGRNFLEYTLLTPGVAIVQGPDGDEITVAGQRGIHNNVSVDGADFNNPFFGEQRGGQRPAFTFNLDAVQEIVVLNGGAPAEFGRSSSGFVNVITKSGTNEFHGSAHYFGKFADLSGNYSAPTGGLPTFNPDFSQSQFGFTLGGPLKRDRAFFFLAYDQQIYSERKYAGQSRGNAALNAWMDTAYNGALQNDFRTLDRSNDARVFMGKFDFRLSQQHNLSLKYNYTWSEQMNGTFDVPTWGVSANAVEKDWSHAVNGSLQSYLSSTVSNELRFQWSREDRPRPYDGPRSALLGPNPTGDGGDRPFPDTAMDFANGYRFGMPFFIPVEYYDKRIQILDNVSIVKGNHFIKFGAEYNKVNSVQTFIGFANSRYIFNSVPGFLSFVENSSYVECSDGSNNTTGACPAGTTITGPVLLYLQQAGVDQSVIASGTQDIAQTDLGVYIQDSWKPSPRLTVNYGLRWEAELQPDPITPPSQVFFAPFIGQTVTNGTGTYTFPSDGTIPSDKSMWQPRLGITFDPKGDGRQVFRGSAGLYYARIPALNLASSRSTNGSNGFTYFRNSELTGVLGPVPAYGSLLPDNVPAGSVFLPSVFVFDKNFKNPRTLNVTLSYERQLGGDLAGMISYTHARTDRLTRFINRNAGVFGSPWGSGLTGPTDPNGIADLTVVESSAKSRYHGVTIGLRRVLDPDLQFEVNYTLSWDKSDDDNERDPFTFRYARADNLAPEYNWSDRDQRHRANGWFQWRFFGNARLNGRISFASAQPVSVSCGPSPFSPFAPPAGSRAASAADRNCADGSVLTRNTLRKDNDFFSLDLGLTYPVNLGRQGRVEGIIQVFNVTGSENFKDPAYGGLLFNFDGTIAQGYGDPRQAQVGVRWVF